MANDQVDARPIKLEGGTSFSVNDDGRSVAEIENLIRFLQPVCVQRTAASYLAAAEKLSWLNDVLVSQATEMAKVWEGPSSVEAQQALRTLHATIRELATRFKEVGGPLEWLGKRLLEHQDFVKNQSGAWSDNTFTFDDSMRKRVITMDKGVRMGSQDEMAGQHLRLLNDDLLKVYEQWPTHVQKVLPDIKPPALPDPDLPAQEDIDNHEVPPVTGTTSAGDFESPGIGDIGGPPLTDLEGTGPPGSVLTPAGAYPDGAVDAGGTGSDGRYPDAAYPDGTIPGTGSPDGTGPDASALDGTGPNAGPDLPADPGTPGTGGLNTSDPRTTLEDFQRPANWDPSTSPPHATSPYATPGTGTGPGTGAGNTAGMGGLPLNARSAAATGNRMPFIPMGGAGAAHNESEEKENNTWLHEDDDVWGGDADDAVSDRIG
ncbi:hypothetical protein FAF44_04940 [Nonomuraea sp. MG754425]|uniref:hypothetical protein n=1 Tax=Nonomuraea sp. MG754425 TaxID=2570319 RepID=UPI001F407725|nr:hypothetical protein [Nonomuraea sp. MG754425]MCF6467757.1 hypothetical protein [Nonomuraea sp. MG754425]